MDTIHGVPEVESACAKRIPWAASHKPWQIRLALDHLRRWDPVRPLLLPGNLQEALPLKAGPADAHAVAQCATTGLDHVEKSLGGVDDDRAGRFAGAKEYDLPLKDWIELLLGRIGNYPGLLAVTRLRECARSRDAQRYEQSKTRREQNTKRHKVTSCADQAACDPCPQVSRRVVTDECGKTRPLLRKPPILVASPKCGHGKFAAKRGSDRARPVLQAIQ